MLESKKKIITCVLAISIFLALAQGSEIQERKSLSITIYDNNFAIVKDVRKIKFDKGSSMVYFTDVAKNLQPGTVTFKPLKNPDGIKVYEQNFKKNIINQ